MASPDKVLITNLSALRAKHGSDGLARIRRSLHALIAADAARGLHTRVVALNDRRTAKSLGIDAVSDVADAAATKHFIDAVDAEWTPAYFVLVGAADVVCSQPLRNPLNVPSMRELDDDPVVPSDLPYASDHEYSTGIEHFRGATRVVGRISDGQANSSPTQLVTALRTAATYASRPRREFEKFWALTAADWRRSSVELLTKTLGTTDGLVEIPPDLAWRESHTRRSLHYFNCHGASNRPQMQGQRGSWRPVVMNPKQLLVGNRLAPGTIVISECCYTGAMVPRDEKSGPAFVDVYLRKGAYAFLGSSTEVWGGIETNHDADLLVRYFLHHVLEGTSTGRALLQARQDYVLRKTVLTPTDLKTLGQFTLFGDPSVHAVRPTRLRSDDDAEAIRGLAARRRRLRANGRALRASTDHASGAATALSASATEQLRTALTGQLSHRFGAKAAATRFDVVAPGGIPVATSRHVTALAENTATGAHLALASFEEGVLQEVRTLRRR